MSAGKTPQTSCSYMFCFVLFGVFFAGPVFGDAEDGRSATDAIKMVGFL